MGNWSYVSSLERPAGHTEHECALGQHRQYSFRAAQGGTGERKGVEKGG